MKGETYEQFVEKFKPKKTTDDCYTPPLIYDGVADWVCAEYGINRDAFCRPFYPGGDYETFDYTGKIVVDNPPFSILSEILRFYIKRNIKFFLFAPALTLFSGATEHCTTIPVGATVTYENGAVVCTSFVTNLDDSDIRVRTAPRLYRILKSCNDASRKEKTKTMPKYEYPKNVATAAEINRLSKAGIDFEIRKSESLRVRALDAQLLRKKAIFGSGYLISDDAAMRLERAERERAERERAERERAERERAERERAERWQLSEREKAIIAELNKK